MRSFKTPFYQLETLYFFQIFTRGQRSLSHLLDELGPKVGVWPVHPWCSGSDLAEGDWKSHHQPAWNIFCILSEKQGSVFWPPPKKNSLNLFMDTFHITQHHHVRCPCVHKTCRYFQPAVVLLVNDSIPTSGICNDWSAKENCIYNNWWFWLYPNHGNGMIYLFCTIYFILLWFVCDVFHNVEVGYLTIFDYDVTIFDYIWLNFDYNLTITWL